MTRLGFLFLGLLGRQRKVEDYYCGKPTDMYVDRIDEDKGIVYLVPESMLRKER